MSLQLSDPTTAHLPHPPLLILQHIIAFLHTRRNQHPLLTKYPAIHLCPSRICPRTHRLYVRQLISSEALMDMKLYSMVQTRVPLEVGVRGLAVVVVDEREAESEVVDGGRTVEDMVV